MCVCMCVCVHECVHVCVCMGVCRAVVKRKVSVLYNKSPKPPQLDLTLHMVLTLILET